jgi:two-component system, chemotaxis family, protein-glutamate methylesterase/glutaminase
MRDIVVLGASAGGVEALTDLVSTLAPDLPASVFVVLHTAPHSPGYLAEILSRAGPLRAIYARDNEEFERGGIYVAPPDLHLLLEPPQCMRLIRGARENRTRPAVDPLFRSAALGFGARVIGAVLSGNLDDGTAGLLGIKMCGGLTLIQDPQQALVYSMPESARRTVQIDHCKSAKELGVLISELTRAQAPAAPKGDATMRRNLGLELKLMQGGNGEELVQLGDPSLFTCPECHGMLVRLRDKQQVRFRCHTGHAYSADALLAAMTQANEEAFWNNIRTLQETAMLMKHLAEHWSVLDASVARDFSSRADAMQEKAAAVRRLAKDSEAFSKDKVEQELGGASHKSDGGGVG